MRPRSSVATRSRLRPILPPLRANAPRTIANGASHALMRIETMALMGGIDLPLEAIREQIRRGIDVVVHQERDPSGVRRVVEIAELSPERADPYRLSRIYP